MPEGAQRLASLIVVGGPLDGRRYDLEEVVTEVLLGSDPDCHLYVDAEGVSPIHARLWTELNGAVVHETRAPAGLFVNEQKVDDQAPVKDGDSLWMGPPGEPGSVRVECRFEPWVEVLPEAPAGTEEEGAGVDADEEAPLPVASLGADEVFELDLGPGGTPSPPTAVAAPTGAESSGEAPGLPEEAPPVLSQESPVEFSLEPAPGETPGEPPGSDDASFPGAEAVSPGAAEAPSSDDVPIEAPEPPSPESSAPVFEPAQLAEDALFVEAEPPAPPVGPSSPEAEPFVAAGGAPVFGAGTPESGVESVAPEAEVPGSATGHDSRSDALTDDALFVEAEPPAPEAPGGDPFFVGEPSPPLSEGPAAPPATADDAWAIAVPEAPAEVPAETPPPKSTAPAEAPEEEDFFIAEELPEAAASVPAAPPAGAVPAEAGVDVSAATPEPLARAPLPPRQPAQEASPREEGTPPGGEGPASPAPLSAGIDASASSAPPAASPETPPAQGAAVGDGASAPAPSQPAAAPRETPSLEGEATPVPRRAAAAVPRPRRPGPRRAASPGMRRTGRRRPQRGVPEWVRPVAMGAGLALALGIVGFGLVWWLGRTLSVEAVSPARARVGQSAVITGGGFSETPSENTVLFGGARAEVLAASKTRLEVEVPDAVVEAGAERRVPVVVRSGSLESDPVEIAVFQGPRLHGLSPDVALPDEEVLLAGAGWGIGATVRFGAVEAEILEIDSTRIRARVPELPGGYGTSAPVVVTVGGVESNPAPFFLGRIPLVTAVSPQAASVGDVLTISGRGFERDAVRNDVRVAGVQALVVSASADELQVVVPRLGAGDPTRSVELRVPGLDGVGRGVVAVGPARDPVGLRFVAEPFSGPSAHPHAVVSTDLGPAFVLAASGDRSAAQRALSAQQALNAAIPTLASAPGVVIEARDVAMKPALALSGGSSALLEITAEDAAAYNEDWTRLRGRARAVTPERLARWWEVVARDLVLVLLRGEPPQFAAGLATEGRVFQQVYDAARRGGGPPITRQILADLSPAVREGLRVVALRVPVSVSGESPAGTAAASAVAPGASPAAPSRDLQLDGIWTGSESEDGSRRFLTVTFRRDHGSIAYEGGITFEVPFLSLERPGRDRVRFTVQVRGGIRHYHGAWNGESLSGDISRDGSGSDVVGRFELRPR